MKTVFLPIIGRLQARNILRTNVFRTLKADPHVRLVVFAPSAKVGEYEKEFGGGNTVFEGFGELPGDISSLDAFFSRITLFFIDSPTARFLRKEWLIYGKRSPVRYILSRSLLFLFGTFRPLRSLVRALDYRLITDRRYAHFFEAHKPDVVFSPRIDGALDRSFLRHAKKRDIKTVGMISSWDNISYAKYPFRILPDTLIVHNEIIKNEAVRYLDMPEGHIVISGIPHFDHYVATPRSSRDEFFRRTGISDPRKRIILFASVGVENPTEWQVLRFLDNAILRGDLPSDTVVLFRLHPSGHNTVDRSLYSKNVVFDDSKSMVTTTHTYSEVLPKDMQHLADTLCHASVTVNSGSTMSIDAAAFDKPIVNIAYDGDERLLFHNSIAKAYTSARAHLLPIVESKGTRIVRSHKELLAEIRCYLSDPSRDRDGRHRIVREQCYLLDGHAGRRVAECVLAHARS